MGMLNPRRFLFALAILSLPLSYSVKFMLGWNEVTWVAPSLIIALLLTLFLRIKQSANFLLLIAAALTSAFFGSIILKAFGISFSLYDTLRDPVKLILNVNFFAVCFRFFMKEREFAIKWVSISVICQFIVGVLFMLSAYDVIELPVNIQEFTKGYRARQVLWLSDTVGIMRMGGSFIEAPPFGLFMLASVVILYLEKIRHNRSRWVKRGLFFATLGVLCSLSTQILLAFFVIAAGEVYRLQKKTGKEILLVVGILFLFCVFPIKAIHSLQEKMSEENPGGHGLGGSVGERTFHIQNYFSMIKENPQMIPFGIGMGQYGKYTASVHENLKDTITPQVLPIDWLSGFGLVGTSIMLVILLNIGKRVRRAYNFLGLLSFVGLLLANMFQSSWLWEAWFMALAYMNIPSEEKETKLG